MEHFFVSATLDTGKELTLLGWEDADTAITGLADRHDSVRAAQ
jgi:hypothetical protein